jgi:hypothetical protein
MKTSNVLSKRFTLPLLIAGVLFGAQLPNAKADYLYWTDAQLGTSSITNGYNFAEQTLRRANASGIRRQSTEVAGTIAGSYVAIHCVATAPRITAIIMVIGPNQSEVVRVRDAVRTGMMKWHIID